MHVIRNAVKIFHCFRRFCMKTVKNLGNKTDVQTDSLYFSKIVDTYAKQTNKQKKPGEMDALVCYMLQAKDGFLPSGPHLPVVIVQRRKGKKTVFLSILNCNSKCPFAVGSNSNSALIFKGVTS